MSEKPYIYINNCPVYVTRKNVKNINFRIYPDHVNISVPKSLPDYKMVQAIEEKRQKISQQLEELKKKQGQPNNSKPRTVTSILFLGEKRPVEFKRTNKLSYEDNKFILPELLEVATPEYFEASIDILIKQMLRDIIQKLLNKWEAITGLKCTGFSIRKMKTRWGSCTPSTGKMRFNFYLATQSEDVISSVVLHELIHIKEENHQKGFYNLLYKYMPDYDKYNKQLKSVSSPVKYIY